MRRTERDTGRRMPREHTHGHTHTRLRRGSHVNTHTRRGSHVTREQRACSDTTASQGRPRIAGRRRKLGRGQEGWILPYRFRSGAWPCRHLDFGRPASRTARENFSVAPARPRLYGGPSKPAEQGSVSAAVFLQVRRTRGDSSYDFSSGKVCNR